MQYLVQMKLADSVRPKNPEDTIAFIKQYVFPTLDVWKAKYGGLKVSEAKRLPELEEERLLRKPVVPWNGIGFEPGK